MVSNGHNGAKKIDEVAFIRFASVYRRFEDITEFSEEVEKLTSD